LAPRKILNIINTYEIQFKKAGILRKRIPLNKNWNDCTKMELLSHAYYLTSGIKKYLKKNKVGKVGRHLGSLQTILMVTGWQTLKESMDHNRPK
jgi:hypothetical protein